MVSADVMQCRKVCNPVQKYCKSLYLPKKNLEEEWGGKGGLKNILFLINHFLSNEVTIHMIII